MISPATAAELFADPDWSALVAEYADEFKLEGMPPADARFATYDALEKAGILHSFAARVDGRLVGFIAVLGQFSPHYSFTICVTESFFVAKAYRHHLDGLRLLKAAEDKARELKSPGLLVSAPFGGNLWELMPKLKYKESNRVFYKPLPVAA
jgi:GNAT superfamily N-acetyltransferase